MREWEKKHPGRVENIFSSLSTVVPSHLMDRDRRTRFRCSASDRSDPIAVVGVAR
jgi:hypothetical protein